MREVVVIVPYVENRVLMQLRDEKAHIVFPGHWGFFGGSLNSGEPASQGAGRELFEETSYKPSQLHYLSTDRIGSHNDRISHSFYCALSEPLEHLELNEGSDWGLFSLAEVKSTRLYSDRFDREYPVIPEAYLFNTVGKVFDQMAMLNGE